MMAANSTGDAFHAREPSESHVMKARPSTSTRLGASKPHQFGPNAAQYGFQGSQTLKFG